MATTPAQLPKRATARIDKLALRMATQPPVTIATLADHGIACGWIQQIQEARKAITNHFKPIKDSINSSRATVLRMEKTALARLEPHETHLAGEIYRWERDEAPADLVLPAGHSRRAKISVVVESLHDLIEAVHNGEVDQDCVAPNLQELTKRAKRLGGLYNVPGTRVVHAVTVITAESNREA